MRVHLLLILIISFLVVFISQANGQQKKFDPGFIFGFNTSQVDGDNMSGFNKIGLFGGITVSFPFNEKWSGQMEMLYTQKGSRKYYPSGTDSIFVNGSWDALKLHYIEVPFYAIYKYSKRLDTYFGLAAAKMIYFDFRNSPNGKYNSSFFDKFYTNEVSFLLGTNYHLNENLAATARLNYSWPIIYNVGTRNVVLSFGLHFHLFPAKIM